MISCRDYDPPGLWCASCRAGDTSHCQDPRSFYDDGKRYPLSEIDYTILFIRITGAIAVFTCFLVFVFQISGVDSAALVLVTVIGLVMLSIPARYLR